MKIGSVDLDARIMVIAEIGNNHEGDPARALELVAAAAEAGADVVKVQVINPERLVNRSQVERVAQLSRFRLPVSTWREMAALAQEKGMLFMASAFDEQSLESVAELAAAVKIASGDLDFGPLLVRAAKIGKPIILSTGMAALDEIRAAVEIIARNLPVGQPLAESLALLHCVSLYPAPLETVNLRAIPILRSAFNVTIGYSDHTLGIEMAVAAMALGARIIEKHFTLDKTRTSFRDHAFSSDPVDMKRLTTVAHAFDVALGSGEKTPTPAEAQMAVAARRCVVAARDLAAGTTLAAGDLDFVRPRQGLPPLAAPTLIGRVLRVALKQHEAILESHCESA